MECDVTAQQLILDGNAFGPDGVQALARGLGRNTTLTKLLLSRTCINVPNVSLAVCRKLIRALAEAE